MTLYVKKMDLTRAWPFLRTNKKFPLKGPLSGGTLHKMYSIWYLNFPAQIKYFAKMINNGHMQANKYFGPEIRDVTCPRKKHNMQIMGSIIPYFYWRV